MTSRSGRTGGQGDLGAAEEQLRTAITGGGDATATLSAEASYRAAYGGTVEAEVTGLDRDARESAIKERLAEENARLGRIRQAAIDLAGSRAGSEGDADAVTASSLADYTTVLLRIEELEAMLGILDPSHLTERLDVLLTFVTSTDIGFKESHLPKYTDAEQAASSAEIALLNARYEAALGEYVQIARTGAFVDPATGEIISGAQREMLGALIESQLVGSLEGAHWEGSVIFGWSRYDDPRDAIAAEHQAMVDQQYAPFEFLSFGRQPTM
ncbi:MAG TPA: hypothetical protein VLD62_12425, partial [Acidimicrobiia bacterium]|nr:hypothetical protein [Acidimicrobiia bacterium]